MEQLYSIYGHHLIVEMAREKGCYNSFFLEDGRVYYTSALVDHGEGKSSYQIWEKSWDPSRDPEAIQVLKDHGVLPSDFLMTEVSESV
jgi:hypothetical protein